MDKKNTIIGVLLLMAAFTLMVLQPRQVAEPEEPKTTGEEVETSSSENQKSVEVKREGVPEIPSADESEADIEEEIVRLENGYFIVEFTNIGGAVKRVFLMEYSLTK